jgi:hypothetical protein
MDASAYLPRTTATRDGVKVSGTVIHGRICGVLGLWIYASLRSENITGRLGGDMFCDDGLGRPGRLGRERAAVLLVVDAADKWDIIRCCPGIDEGVFCCGTVLYQETAGA